MDDKTKNFLNYNTVAELTGSEVVSYVSITALFLWFATIIISQRLLISIWGVLYLLAFLGFGFYAKNKKTEGKLFYVEVLLPLIIAYYALLFPMAD